MLTGIIEGVETLCLDAGNTVIFLDHARLARFAGGAGRPVDVDAVIAAEGRAKRAQELDALHGVDWPGRARPGAHAWGGMVGTILHEVGVGDAALPALLETIWTDHVRLNLWSRVPPGLGDALRRARAAGLRVVVVSNSEGMLEELFETLGLAGAFDRVVDSAIVGVAKPDPRIFHEALGTTPPERALHLGDSIATDVAGARAAGLRVALVDPYGHCAGRAPDVPRVDGVVPVADAIRARLRR